MRPARLPLLLLLLALAAPVAAQSPAGDWTGEIAVPGQPLGIEVTLAEADGAWSGIISIPAQNLHGFTLAGVEVAGDSVRFRMDGVPGTPTFAGTLQQDGEVIAGTFTQGGGTLAFRLQRAEAAAAEEAAATEAALDGFGDFVEAAMEAWHVPGAAVALVQGGEVVWMEGYGLRDVERELPVTPQTLFPIGSATKAFTATALGILHDEGLLDWDTPVHLYLPGFALMDPFATAEMTAVDLLVHNSGLPRHDLLWYVTPYTREELVERLRYLEPTQPFRAAWQYQNLMYMTAGYLAGHLAESSWEEVVQENIFAPLGMDDATFDVEGLPQRPDFARGYGGGLDTTEVLDYHPLEAIAPAGAINASAEDMVRWVQLQLSDGTVGDAEVLSAGTLRFLHAPQHVVSGEQPLAEAPYLLYALGWFVEPFRGRRLLHHGGNIDGFSALVAFMPDDDLGIVVLTNKDASPLPRILMLTAFDRLLGEDGPDWNAQIQAQVGTPEEREGTIVQEDVVRVAGTQPSHPLGDYAGTYEHPAYGPVTVTLDGDQLRGSYFGIEGPLRHYHYDTFTLYAEALDDSLRVTFYTAPEGDVAWAAVPLEPSLDPLMFERLPEAGLSEPDYLSAFVGAYRIGGQAITIALRGETLTMTVPGQPTYVLEPTEPDTFQPQNLPGFRVRFEREDGEIVRLLAIQPNGTFRAERVVD